MANKKFVDAIVDIGILMYDILNETYLRGRTIQNDQNYKEVASLFASEDEENAEKIYRSIKRGFTEIQSELSEYLNDNGLPANNDNFDADSKIEIKLALPSNYNKPAAAGVAEAVHDYLRNVAIADWYMVTNKADAADYVTLAQRSLESLRKCVSRRERPKKTNA